MRGAQVVRRGAQVEMRGAQADGRGDQVERRGAQAGRNAPHVASNTLDSLSLREIADELASIEEIDAVMESEKNILIERHKEETARQQEKLAQLSLRQSGEMEEMNRNMVQNKARQDDLKRRMQDRLNSATSTAPPCTPSHCHPRVPCLPGGDATPPADI